VNQANRGFVPEIRLLGENLFDKHWLSASPRSSERINLARNPRIRNASTAEAAAWVGCCRRGRLHRIIPSPNPRRDWQGWHGGGLPGVEPAHKGFAGRFPRASRFAWRFPYSEVPVA